MIMTNTTTTNNNKTYNWRNARKSHKCIEISPFEKEEAKKRKNLNVGVFRGFMSDGHYL